MSQELDYCLLYGNDVPPLERLEEVKMATKCKQSQGTIASKDECREKPVGTLIYSTQIDEDYILTTQIPLCRTHLAMREEAFKKAGYPYKKGSVTNA